MFRVCPRRLAIGAYSLFMMEQKNHPKLKGLAVGDRGKATSKLYHSLPPAELEALKKRAKNYVSKTPKKAKAAKAPKEAKAKSPRAPNPYTLFVKANIGKFEKLPHKDRMKAVAKLWKQQKGH